jgi:hypothetical protein
LVDPDSNLHLIEDVFGQSIVEVHQEIAAELTSPALAGGLKVKAATTAREVQRPTGWRPARSPRWRSIPIPSRGFAMR